MKKRLESTFAESRVEVRDLTGGGDHIEVEIEYPGFMGKTRIEQHQMVMGVFSAELKTGELHAIVIKSKVR